MYISRLLFFMSMLCILSCNNTKEEPSEEITKLEKELSNIDLNKKDSLGNVLLNKYLAYKKDNPTNENTEVYTFKAAELANGLDLPTLAIETLEEFLKEYSNSKLAPQALFLEAFIYENKLNNLEMAKIKYQLFLDTYPNHPLAADARASISNLGLSPEELIKKFEAQNAQTTK